MGEEACLDPSYAFRDYETFARCFYSWAGANMTTTAYTSLPTNNTFCDVIQRCISSYCDSPSSDLGGCGHGPISWDPYDIGLKSSLSFHAAECSDINKNANTDIAGPGLTILGYIWLALRFLETISRIERKNWESQLGMYLIQKAAEHRPVIRFVLIEFQEAQSFLMISIQIASLYVMLRRPELYGAVSIHQLIINKTMTRSISLEAIVFITFGLWLVHKADMKSWYILFCSTLTVILSMVTFHMSDHWKVKPTDLSLPQGNGDLYECGHHPPPLIWCGNWDYNDSENPWIRGGFVISIPLFCSLFCHALLELLQFGPWARLNLRDSDDEWRLAVYYCISGLYPTSSWIKLTLKICVELMLLTIISFSSGMLFRPLFLDLTDWNLGQVIAMSIWAPVIIKYLYWSLFGVQAYSADRIPSPYKITNTETHVPPTDEICLERRFTV